MGLMALRAMSLQSLNRWTRSMTLSTLVEHQGIPNMSILKFHDHPCATFLWNSVWLVGGCYAPAASENELQLISAWCEETDRSLKPNDCDVGGPYDSKTTYVVLTWFRLEKPDYSTSGCFGWPVETCQMIMTRPADPS